MVLSASYRERHCCHHQEDRAGTIIMREDMDKWVPHPLRKLPTQHLISTISLDWGCRRVPMWEESPYWIRRGFCVQRWVVRCLMFSDEVQETEEQRQEWYRDWDEGVLAAPDDFDIVKFV